MCRRDKRIPPTGQPSTAATQEPASSQHDAWIANIRAQQNRLSARLAAISDDGNLGRQAWALIENGKFDEAAALLDRIIAKQEAQIDLLADSYFMRGDILRLQFRHKEALAYFEKAYHYRPDNSSYALNYALSLIRERNFTKAIEVYSVLVKQLRTKPPNARIDPRKIEEVGPAIAGSLYYLADAYRGVGRLVEAESTYKEALAAYRDLAVQHPALSGAGIVYTLSSLADLYRAMQRPTEAYAACVEVFPLVSQSQRRGRAADGMYYLAEVPSGCRAGNPRRTPEQKSPKRSGEGWMPGS